MTFAEFCNQNEYLICWILDPSKNDDACGDDVAIFPEYSDFQSEYSDLNGNVKDGTWMWDGDDGPNFLRNLKLWSDKEEWDRQWQDYQEAA